MTTRPATSAIVPELDAPTVLLVRLAGVIAGGTEPALRITIAECARTVNPVWVEELILQSYLFAGFPRALNAMREWRRLSGRAAPMDDEGQRAEAMAPVWRERGEETCSAVYDGMYDQLRINIARLHPALDAWMVIEGYGKVMSRPGLDLVRRELCIVAVCAVARQDRQLQSHLHGALNVGASPGQVAGVLDALGDQLGAADLKRARAMLARVLGK